uniref:HCO3_cotransp domain-containing protein n=1 Tax=Macrostomum lignano TaxID=282301 RepID=A0A1I8FFA7_9PLAT
FTVPRKFGTPIVIGVTFLIGLPSAISVTILRNQDFVWGFALMISGIMFQLLVIKYGAFGPFKMRSLITMALTIGPLTIVTMIIIVVVAPIEAIGLLVWWGYEIISSTSDAPSGERWFDYGVETFMTVIT